MGGYKVNRAADTRWDEWMNEAKDCKKVRTKTMRSPMYR